MACAATNFSILLLTLSVQVRYDVISQFIYLMDSALFVKLLKPILSSME